MSDMLSHDKAGSPPERQGPHTPRWVKVFGMIAMVLIVLFIVLMVFGGGRHGPGRHMRLSGAGPGTPSADARR